MVIKYVKKHEKISHENIKKICECSERTAKRDLQDLVKKNVVKRVEARYVAV